MKTTYKTSTECEFKMFALLEKWYSAESVTAFAIASANGISMSTWWDFDRDYRAFKGIGKQ